MYRIHALRSTGANRPARCGGTEYRMEDEELWVSRLMCLCPTPLSVDALSSRYVPLPESTEGGASLIDPLMNGVVVLRGTCYEIAARASEACATHEG
jgi:hypothetical protein